MSYNTLDFQIYIDEVLEKAAPKDVASIEKLQDELISAIEVCIEGYIEDNDI